MCGWLKFEPFFLVSLGSILTTNNLFTNFDFTKICNPLRMHCISFEILVKAQWDPLLNRMGQNGHNFVRDMSLLESQSKGCVNPTFNPAHKWIFAMYLLGCICTVGARARAHPKF